VKDVLTATTARKVSFQSDSGTTKNERMIIKLTIRVTNIEFDPKASQMKVNGIVIVENDYVPLRSYHSLDLEIHRKFVLEKEEGWDSVAMGILDEAVSNSSRATTFVVMMVPGEAHIHRITEHRTIYEHPITQSLPGKRGGAADYDKAVTKFHTALVNDLLRLQNLESAVAPTTNITPLLIASPGFAAQNFVAFMKAYASEKSHKPLNALVAKTVTTHSSSASPAALSEVLSSPALKNRIDNARYLRESTLLDNMYASIRRDDGKAWYGPKEVEYCIAQGAVCAGGGVLLVVNSLFRSDEIDVRKRWVAAVDAVKKAGGEVRVVSEDHESGQRLAALGGIAALLSWPIYEIEDEETHAVETQDHS
jgi:protein pelota